MLSAADVRLLDRLTLGASSSRAVASSAGLRRSRSVGPGLEFQDYRPYQPGDDLRSIDWTVEARLGQLVTRVSRAEGHLRISLLVDVSASMRVGSPDKRFAACRLAAALCYVAVARRDEVGLVTFDGGVCQHLPLATGRIQLSRVIDALQAPHDGGASAVDDVLMKYAAAARGPALAIVLSDFFQEGSRLDGLRYLLHRGLTPVVIQMLAPEEIDPHIAEEIELLDVENPQAPPVVADGSSVARYRERLDALSQTLRQFCAVNRLGFLQLRSSDGLDRHLDACARVSIVGTYA